MPPQRTSIADRFIQKIHRADDGCWLWTGGKNENGYPLLWDADKHGMIRAHRFIYEIWHGPIPTGLVLDHLCRVRHCVNPQHLEAVTCSENLLRSPLLSDAAKLRESKKTHDSEFMREIGRKGGRAKRREDMQSTEGMRSSVSKQASSH
jgi:hypothetical protein